MTAAGYAHPDYARSLAEYGTPTALPRCGGWILERPVPGFAATDAMGCYPLFVCRDWSQLRVDIEGLGSRLVSLALVTDPFGNYTPEELHASFDIVRPFKHHYITDLRLPLSESVSKHHRYYARKSLRQITVDICHEPSRHLREWSSLYDNLVRRHNITGIRAFSPESFLRQLSVRGMVLFLARLDGEVVGAYVVATCDDVAYSHLSAFSDVGYRIRAAYALRWTALEYLSGRKVRYVDMGGTAGLDDERTSGLAKFKSGWSSETRPVYFCGRILDPETYGTIVRAKASREDGYFPAYRSGEFAGGATTARAE